MKITQVKTAFKIADVEWTKQSPKLTFNYLKVLKDEKGKVLPQSILTQNVARVYLIVVDGEILKIGGSQCNGGIKGTLQIYQDGGVNGRPSIRSFGIWYFLLSTISKGKKIEFYMIYQENFEAEVKGLFGFNHVENASLNYKLLEEYCNRDYRSVEDGNFPEWNIQEQGADWPEEIKEKHSELLVGSVKNSKSNRKKIKLS
ncbi:MAG: hypothetical protein K5622_02390 [Endomicrobiaceae bacterium]|nr:hypothetical protein [Endomicrobiaceae bacterium]